MRSSRLGPPNLNLDVVEEEEAVVEIVKDEVAGLVPGVTSLGAKEQDARAGRPEQLSETASSKAVPVGLTVTL